MKELEDKTNESQKENVQRVSQESSNGGTAQLMDNRSSLAVQRKLQDSMSTSSGNDSNPVQRKTNRTGLPDNLKSGIENLSGHSMDDVKVHYNSSKPAQLQAHAYAQGTDIHLGSGQEKHLAHEAWHVVQQKQGRVKPTKQLKSKVNINDDEGLEREADVMGARALRGSSVASNLRTTGLLSDDGSSPNQSGLKQLKKIGGSSNAEQPIQANGWIRDTVTGDTSERKNGQQPRDFEESFEDRFMSSGEDFRYGPNYQIDPDTVGGENGVIEIPEEYARPDDVERNEAYREAIHKFHDLYFFLQKTKPEKAREIDVKLKGFQDEAKYFAKDFKKNKRNLIKSDTDYAKNTYLEAMRELTTRIENAFNSYSESQVMTANDFANSKKEWRAQWRKILDVVESVLRERWPEWRKTIQRNVSRQTGMNKMVMRRENWRLQFGGSLGKGYKGPPKQNVRFITTRFDVDANMDAPALANYLLGKDGRKVDRGTIQVRPEDRETQVKEMDIDMDQGIRDKLVDEGIATEEQVDKKSKNGIVSEEFETLVNARENRLDPGPKAEWQRSVDEQELRDEVTRLNADPNREKIDRFVNMVQNSREVKGLLKRGRWLYLFTVTNKYLNTKVELKRNQITELRRILDIVERNN